MSAACGTEECRVETYDGGGGLGCPACGWPDARNPATGMTDDEAARWLGGLSGSPRYGGDGWRRLLDEDGSLDHATAAAKRNADADQLPAIRAAADQLRKRQEAAR